MFALAYVSSAVHPFSTIELQDLLQISRADNSKLGVTGMLLYKDGNFMQVLEGDQKIVSELSAKIQKDRRHKGVIVIYQGRVDQRQFPDWSMGFHDLNSPEFQNTPGYNDFLNTPLTGSEFSANPSRARKLLLIFKKNLSIQT